jgi:hypothetical protein
MVTKTASPPKEKTMKAQPATNSKSNRTTINTPIPNISAPQSYPSPPLCKKDRKTTTTTTKPNNKNSPPTHPK